MLLKFILSCLPSQIKTRRLVLFLTCPS
uniref:Uncharacterized protein MANES_08G018800 n=2 Tax=Rhizophora mucronata TaxID=61149 RepID=A0A2P2J7P3_RHIMU